MTPRDILWFGVLIATTVGYLTWAKRARLFAGNTLVERITTLHAEGIQQVFLLLPAQHSYPSANVLPAQFTGWNVVQLAYIKKRVLIIEGVWGKAIQHIVTKQISEIQTRTVNERLGTKTKSAIQIGSMTYFVTGINARSAESIEASIRLKDDVALTVNRDTFAQVLAKASISSASSM